MILDPTLETSERDETPERVLAPRRSRLPRHVLPLAAGVACTVFVAACRIDAKRPKLHYSLNQTTTQIDEETGEPVVPSDVQEHVLGALGMLFGSPDEPKFLLTEEWTDDGYNPNYPQYAADDNGSGDLSDEELEGVAAGNLVRFEDQLAAIDAGRYADVVVPATMIDTVRYWRSDVLDPMAADDWTDSEEFRAEARALFEDWYPSLRESAELYRIQCVHCHGVSGGGDGPTSQFLDPRPRDYRQGKFKFTAQKDKAKPRRSDLFQILAKGATGTAMPSFRRLADAELHGLVDYVKLLSIRGETESMIITLAEEEDWLVSLEMIQEAYTAIWERWLDVEGKVVAWDGPLPEATPAAIERGRELFNDAAKGNCASCHGSDGLGLGSAVVKVRVDPVTGANLLDSHGNPQIERLDNGLPVSAYEDDWGRQILPRDLTRGVFRGGRRPIDIYRRIYSGINGTPMPALGGAVPDEDIWAMVHYVRTLSERHPVHAADAGHGGEAGH